MIGTRGLALGAAGAQERPEIAIAVPGVASSMEPIADNSTDAERIMPDVFDQIVTRNFDEDPEGAELRPAIATSWERTDPLTWRYTIREGVTFHNGEPLKAETSPSRSAPSASGATTRSCPSGSAASSPPPPWRPSTT